MTHLEPSTADARIGLCVSDFLEIRHDGALVRGVNHVRGTGLECVAPDQFCGRAGLEGNDCAGFLGGVGAAIADNVVGGDVVDGAVVGRDTDAVTDLAVVDGEEDGVC